MSASHIISASCHLSAKNYQNWWKFDEFLTKQFCTVFLRDGVVKVFKQDISKTNL